MKRANLDISSLPGPETIAQRTFANGMMGLAWENMNSPSVVVHGWLWVGSIDERPEQAGLAALTASMMTRGTERRTFAQIGDEIESLGATLGISSGGHTTVFTCKCLVEDLSLVLDILIDCLFNSTFPNEHVEKRRGEILTSLQQRQFNTRAMASLKYHEQMYPHHPYGRSTLGYEETICNLARADVETFYQDNYGTKSTRDAGVTIVGAIPAQQGLDVLESALGAWQGAAHVQAPLPQVPAIDQIRPVYTAIPGKTQSDIVLGWIGLERKNPDFFAAYVANCILGQFGMMGRIGDYVRDEKGLAYYSYTSLDAGLAAGPWSAIAGVAPENVQAAIAAILDQVKRIQCELVSDGELADAKAFLIGSLPLRLEAKESVAAQIAHMQIYQLGLDYLRHYPQHIGAVTAEDVMAVTNKYMDPARYVLSIAGPPEAKES